MAKVNTTETLTMNKAMTQEEIDNLTKKTGEILSQQKKIKIKLPLINPKDDVVEVGINGYVYRIKRGESVEVPESVAEVLEHAGLL